MKKRWIAVLIAALLVLALLLVMLCVRAAGRQKRLQSLNAFVGGVKGVAANLADLDDSPEMAMNGAKTYFYSLSERGAILPLRSLIDETIWVQFRYALQQDAYQEFSAIYDRYRAGDVLSEDDRAYLDKLRAAMETLLDSLLEPDGRTYRRQAANKDYLSRQLADFSAAVSVYGK